MRIFTKTTIASLVVLTFVMMLSIPAFAQNGEGSKKVITKSAGVIGDSVSPNYSFSYLETYIDTSFTINVLTTENVDVVLVQYETGCVSGCNCDLNYQLIAVSGGGYVQPIRVQGIYKDQSKTITFTNVQPGTYKLRISNNLGFDDLASGNGYLYY